MPMGTSAATRDPTPDPSSTVKRVGSVDEDVPPHLVDDPFVRYMMEPPAEDVANLDALIEAGETYGQDHERALSDLMAGRHPLQRSRPASR